jgi:hypothetical protein
MASQPTKLLRRISQPHGLSRLNVAGVLHFADEGLRHALDHLHVLLEVRHHRVPCRKEPQQKQGVRLPAASVRTQSCRWRWRVRGSASRAPLRGASARLARQADSRSAHPAASPFFQTTSLLAWPSYAQRHRRDTHAEIRSRKEPQQKQGVRLPAASVRTLLRRTECP